MSLYKSEVMASQASSGSSTLGSNQSLLTSTSSSRQQRKKESWRQFTDMPTASSSKDNARKFCMIFMALLGVGIVVVLGTFVGYHMDYNGIKSTDRLREMLQTRPIAGQNQVEMWELMTPLQIEQFEHYFGETHLKQGSDPEKLPLLNWDEAYYDEWQDSEAVYFGMRHKTTGMSHGIVRTVSNDGDIQEASWWGGATYGLQREIDNDSNVRINLNWRNDTFSYFTFDDRFYELDKNNATNLNTTYGTGHVMIDNQNISWPVVENFSQILGGLGPLNFALDPPKPTELNFDV